MNIKAYLAKINMTLKDFAAYLDCNPRYLSQISQGKKIPGIRLGKDIEEATSGIVTFDLSKKKKKRRQRLQEGRREIGLGGWKDREAV